MLDLDALEKLCDEATPGPWKRVYDTVQQENDVWIVKGFIDRNSTNNCKFIAESRTALPELIKRVRELERQLLKTSKSVLEIAIKEMEDASDEA